MISPITSRQGTQSEGGPSGCRRQTPGIHLRQFQLARDPIVRRRRLWSPNTIGFGVRPVPCSKATRILQLWTEIESRDRKSTERLTFDKHLDYFRVSNGRCTSARNERHMLVILGPGNIDWSMTAESVDIMTVILISIIISFRTSGHAQVS